MNKSTKRLSLYLFIVLFNIQTSSWANDIKELQIEGMSIGDSLLDYYSAEEIKTGKVDYYKDKEFSTFETKNLPESKIYDGIQVLYETKDKRYIIYSISGAVDCRYDFIVCKKAWKEIVPSLIELFKNAIVHDIGTYSHPADTSGNSKVTQINFDFKSGDRVTVEMTDWSEEIGYYDNLRVNIDTKKIALWLKTKAYY